MDTRTAIILITIIGALLLARTDQRVERDGIARSLHAEETTSLQAAHSRSLASMESRRSADLASSSAEHRADLRRRESEHSARISAATAQLAHPKSSRDSAINLIATGMKWELASRQAIVTSCEAAKLDAVVATNIVFTPTDSTHAPYCAQIDHLVVTDNMVLLVDSKRWKGLIFDGRPPSSLAARLALFVNERGLPASYAIHFKKAGAESDRIDILTESGSDSPAVRTQINGTVLRPEEHCGYDSPKGDKELACMTS